ncbi:chromo domain-containing protein lhp1 [Quercus suber]|uniref:Chromo domain-containing protein lhp1 n=1 Tax=Quercus suber TaxID=58331 RepID=A0AAW0L0W2_QUESU
MKGGGKKRNNGGVVGSEPALASPNDAVVATNGGESLVADLGEKDQTQKAKEVGEQEKIQQLQQQQQVEPEAEAKATEEGAAAAEEQEDEQDDDEEEDGDDDEDEAATERPKLDEGFYEIEAIRRKRVRKVTKTKGLRSGKHRKRKRKHGTPHTQPKKKQQRSTFPADVTGVEINIVNETVKSIPPNKSILTDLSAFPQSMYEGDRNGDIKEITKQTGVENGCGYVSQQNDNSKDGNEYDPKLSELKTIMSTNEVNMDKLAIHFEEAKALEGDAPVDGGPKTDCIEPAQSNRRIGAKRRKSSSVKRFKQDSGSREPVLQNATTRSGGSFGRVQQPFTGNPGFRGENSICRNGTDGYKDASNITRIIKPIGYSASVSNNIQDVLVTFTAMRFSDHNIIVTITSSSRIMSQRLKDYEF